MADGILFDYTLVPDEHGRHRRQTGVLRTISPRSSSTSPDEQQDVDRLLLHQTSEFGSLQTIYQPTRKTDLMRARGVRPLPDQLTEAETTTLFEQARLSAVGDLSDRRFLWNASYRLNASQTRTSAAAGAVALQQYPIQGLSAIRRRRRQPGQGHPEPERAAHRRRHRGRRGPPDSATRRAPPATRPTATPACSSRMRSPR